MLAHGKVPPSFALARRIEKWTRLNVFLDEAGTQPAPFLCSEWTIPGSELPPADEAAPAVA
jgi:hypothetical protein